MWCHCNNNIIIVGPQTAPTGLRYTELRTQSITLQWEQLPTEKRGGPSNTYTVNVQGCGGSEQPATSTHITITNLCPNSIYTISVKACTTTCGRYSQSIIVKTQEDGM